MYGLKPGGSFNTSPQLHLGHRVPTTSPQIQADPGAGSDKQQRLSGSRIDPRALPKVPNMSRAPSMSRACTSITRSPRHAARQRPRPHTHAKAHTSSRAPRHARASRWNEPLQSTPSTKCEDVAQHPHTPQPWPAAKQLQHAASCNQRLTRGAKWPKDERPAPAALQDGALRALLLFGRVLFLSVGLRLPDLAHLHAAR